jgi:hypothetical protein
MSQRDKPRLALDNIVAGVRERKDANRTRAAGHLDEIQSVVANTLNGADGVSDIEVKLRGKQRASVGNERVSTGPAGMEPLECERDGWADLRG